LSPLGKGGVSSGDWSATQIFGAYTKKGDLMTDRKTLGLKDTSEETPDLPKKGRCQ